VSKYCSREAAGHDCIYVAIFQDAELVDAGMCVRRASGRFTKNERRKNDGRFK
jgi:hypothetical protein